MPKSLPQAHRAVLRAWERGAYDRLSRVQPYLNYCVLCFIVLTHRGESAESFGVKFTNSKERV